MLTDHLPASQEGHSFPFLHSSCPQYGWWCYHSTLLENTPMEYFQEEHALEFPLAQVEEKWFEAFCSPPNHLPTSSLHQFASEYWLYVGNTNRKRNIFSMSKIRKCIHSMKKMININTYLRFWPLIGVGALGSVVRTILNKRNIFKMSRFRRNKKKDELRRYIFLAKEFLPGFKANWKKGKSLQTTVWKIHVVKQLPSHFWKFATLHSNSWKFEQIFTTASWSFY